MPAVVDVDRMNALTGSRFTESACSSDVLSVYPIDTCIFAGKSEFCDIVIADTPCYGKVLFLDNEIQSAESDEALYHEHLVHPILNALAHVSRKRVLIVGGGEGATAREVLRWSAQSVASVTWVDIDSSLVELCRRHLGWASDSVYNDARLHYFAMDIRTFLAQTQEMFDVVILDLPDPDVEKLSKFDSTELYSVAFMKQILVHLRPQGGVVSHVGPVSPGGASADRRAGLNYMTGLLNDLSMGGGYPYHVTIPSFQGDWGFLMTVPPSRENAWPEDLRVMNGKTQDYAFTWPSYYFSLWI